MKDTNVLTNQNKCTEIENKENEQEKGILFKKDFKYTFNEEYGVIFGE